LSISTLDSAGAAPPACAPAALRLGLLGLGTIGGAVARLTQSSNDVFRAHGIAPVVAAALVRDAGRSRPDAGFTNHLTSDPDAFFAAGIDVVVEALGGEEPARSLVERALDRGIPVVTANKTLVALHGESLAALARRRGTAFRYEASCLAGVPFLGTFERRPLAAAARAVTGILNGTSNRVLTAMSGGATFDSALADAQHRGFAEPDATADVSGIDASQKLAILARLFGRRLIVPGEIARTGIEQVDAPDLAAAAAFHGRVKPIAHASWQGARVNAFVAPAFVPLAHPLAGVSGVTNGLVIEAGFAPLYFVGPGAGPEVTATTLLDDVIEVASERPPRTPPVSPAEPATTAHPETAWFVRIADARRPGTNADGEAADLLGSFGLWCRRIERVGGRRYALTVAASRERAAAATAALETATGARVLALPALAEAAAC
jgi:homoserine dehydrogenase